MESKATRVYQDFEPSMEWVPEDDSDTLLIYLPGFAKEQLRVQLRSRNLILSGERKLHENTWSRFRVEFPVAANCDLNKISAKFEGNILFVRQPKMITPAAKLEEVKPAVVAPPQKPVEAKPQPAAAPQKPVETKPQPAAAPQKPVETKPQPAAAPQKPVETEPDAAPQKPVEAKLPAVIAAPQKPVDESNESTKPAPTIQPNIEKNVGKDKDDPKKVVHEELDGTILDKCKRAAGALAVKLKASGCEVNTIAVVVVGIVVGIYVTNLIKSWTKA